MIVIFTDVPPAILKTGHLQREELGRRDWTRTNDPHHVKVVL